MLCHALIPGYTGSSVLTWVFPACSVFQAASPQVQVLTSLSPSVSSWQSHPRPRCRVPPGAGSQGSSAAPPVPSARHPAEALEHRAAARAPEHRSEQAVLGEHVLKGPGKGFALCTGLSPVWTDTAGDWVSPVSPSPLHWHQVSAGPKPLAAGAAARGCEPALKPVT